MKPTFKQYLASLSEHLNWRDVLRGRWDVRVCYVLGLCPSDAAGLVRDVLIARGHIIPEEVA